MNPNPAISLSLYNHDFKGGSMVQTRCSIDFVPTLVQHCESDAKDFIAICGSQCSLHDSYATIYWHLMHVHCIYVRQCL